MHREFSCRAAIFGLASLATIVPWWLAAQGQPTPDGTVVGTPILWRDPGDIAAKELYWGNASAQGAPQPPFTFVEEDVSGSKPKVLVSDATGTLWNVKLAGDSPRSNEVHAEVAASRLLWALGYHVEEQYYVASGQIADAGELDRASESIGPDGSFTVARFEKRPDEIVRTDRHWSFDLNPFVGTKELSGLMIAMTLISNWDAIEKNNTIFRVRNPDGRVEDWYIVSDLGSSFGRMAKIYSPSRSRWRLDHYKEQPFLDVIEDGVLKLNYEGSGPIETVPVEHARWFAGLASQLTHAQVRRAFEAAGASEAEIEGFSARVMERIRELQLAVEGRPDRASE